MLKYIVRYRCEHYSNPYGSIIGSTDYSYHEQEFDSLEEAREFKIKAMHTDYVDKVELLELMKID